MAHNQPPDPPDMEPRYQPEHNGMYELEFPAPQLSSSDGRGPVLVTRPVRRHRAPLARRPPVTVLSSLNR